MRMIAIISPNSITPVSPRGCYRRNESNIMYATCLTIILNKSLNSVVVRRICCTQLLFLQYTVGYLVLPGPYYALQLRNALACEVASWPLISRCSRKLPASDLVRVRLAGLQPTSSALNWAAPTGPQAVAVAITVVVAPTKCIFHFSPD